MSPQGRGKIESLVKIVKLIPKGDELPIRVSTTGGSGPARVWGHVKSLI